MATIVLTNDDGYTAAGIRAAAKALSALGDVIIVAPEKQQSAVSQKITLHKPLRVRKHAPEDGATIYSVSGSPADCVKMAVAEILKNEKTDLVVSGINQGSNSGFNLFYSGTVAGAIEGMICGIPSIAISLTSFQYTDFSLSAHYLAKIAAHVLAHGLDEETILNVNVPPVAISDCQGAEVCYTSRNRYVESFDVRDDLHGGTYYWLGGTKPDVDPRPNTDDEVVKRNKVAISPVEFNFSREGALEALRGMNLNED